MPRAVHLAVPLLAKSEVLAASLSPVAAVGASHYRGGPAGLGRASIVRQATRGTEGGWEGRRAAQRAQERENVRKEWTGKTLAAPP